MDYVKDLGKAAKKHVHLRRYAAWVTVRRPAVAILVALVAGCFAYVACAEPQQPGAAPQAASGATAPTQAPQPVPATSAAAEPASPAAEFQPRLPMYYGKVVDEKQRQTIYGIQRKYYPQIAELQRQLKNLTAQRDAEIEAVLSPQQKAEVEKLRKEAAARRGGKAAADDAAGGTPSP